jgi:hypothetical protein
LGAVTCIFEANIAIIRIDIFHNPEDIVDHFALKNLINSLVDYEQSKKANK